MRREVLRAAGVDGAEIELFRIFPRRGDHVLERLERRVRFDREQHLEAGRHRHQCEIAQHVVGPRLEQRHADGLPVADHAERVSVRRRLEHRLGRQEAARARPIFDHDLLLGSLGEFLRQQPHGQIGNAAGAIRDGDVNGLRWEGWLCASGSHRANGCAQANGQGGPRNEARTLEARVMRAHGASSLNLRPHAEEHRSAR